MDRNDGPGVVRSEVQAKQGGTSKLTLIVLVVSLALAAGVGVFLLTETNEVAPNRPAAVENQANPGAPPAAKTNP
jgi:flagellar basal body-associated protein FliL